MPDHPIRLRGGWELIPPDAPPSRVTLPITWPADSPRRFQLVRQFGRPSIDPATERLSLQFEDVPGLISAHLNGVPLDINAVHGGSIAPGHPLPARNVLILEVDFDAGRSDRPWGAIALMVGAW